ncbi:hypothetical protein DY926_16775 [Komagataeibacter melaceti]|uniref:Uncharacterized protein n=1 Tax=Komagataeibacter melaceti TaxID=2766577 RepID=A0A371YW11_9PROT|nr:hypothetical protein DY926_16775 [Komagataeibacter melaceti]
MNLSHQQEDPVQTAPSPTPSTRPACHLPRRSALLPMMGLLMAGLALAGCTGRIGEDACFSCANERKASTATTASPDARTPPGPATRSGA